MHDKKSVFLIHYNIVPHYRIPIYNYLANHLENDGFSLTVVTEGFQKGGSDSISHNNIQIELSTISLTRLLIKYKPHILIFFVGLKHPYLFPTLAIGKIFGMKTIHWGHGRDLEHPEARMKNFLYGLEQTLHNAIILYSESLKKHLWKNAQKKSFVANNTIVIPPVKISKKMIDDFKAKHHIRTSKNIIFMGRIEERKRVPDLISAFRLIQKQDIGLLIVGPDPQHLLDAYDLPNVYKMGPIYGDERWILLSIADVFCLPGHLGLSIVDAFWFGLPIITEDVRHAPEIMYLKHGINGFIVPEGDVHQLAEKLNLLLSDHELRERFSSAARAEIRASGHINGMYQGFKDALRFVSRKKGNKRR
jgi:glycosyltransferase involved in cell wall biosynthesis